MNYPALSTASAQAAKSKNMAALINFIRFCTTTPVKSVKELA